MIKYGKSKYIMLAIYCWIIFSCACIKEGTLPPTPPIIIDSICNIIIDTSLPTMKAKKVVVIIMDGARYSETFGDENYTYIPKLKQLSTNGTILTQFYNNGTTNTMNGCNACISGNYSALVNNGSEKAPYPSFLNYYLNCTSLGANKACIISSKDKIAALAQHTNSNIILPEPNTDCGIAGNGTGYRHDTTTYRIAKNYFAAAQPNMTFITFREPDFSGHSGSWQNYLAGIQLTDSLIFQLYTYLQTLPAYTNQTDFFITNDHGRHLDGVADGYVSHGDACMGCKHIMLCGIGPDIKKGVTINTPYELIDISATIAALLHIQMAHNQGKIIKEMIE